MTPYRAAQRTSSIVFVFLKNLYDNEILQSKWDSKSKLSLLNVVYLIYGTRTKRLDPELLKLMIERRLTDMKLQRWHEKLHSNPLCDSYKLFKADFTVEMYFTMLRPAEKNCMYNFRYGSHNLPVSEHRCDSDIILNHVAFV